MKYQFRGGLFDGLTFESNVSIDSISIETGSPISEENLLAMTKSKTVTYINDGLNQEEFDNFQEKDTGWLLRHQSG